MSPAHQAQIERIRCRRTFDKWRHSVEPCLNRLRSMLAYSRPWLIVIFCMVGLGLPSAAAAEGKKITFTNSLKTEIVAYNSTDPDTRVVIPAGESKDVTSNNAGKWKFERRDEPEKPFDEYTETAIEVQTYLVHPANPRIRQFEADAAKGNLKFILKGTSKLIRPYPNQITVPEGGDDLVLMVHEEMANRPVLLRPISLRSFDLGHENNTSFQWEVKRDPERKGYVFTNVFNKNVMCWAAETEGNEKGFRYEICARPATQVPAESTVFQIVPTPNGQGVSLVPAVLPGNFPKQIGSIQVGLIVAFNTPVEGVVPHQTEPNKAFFLPRGWGLSLAVNTPGARPPEAYGTFMYSQVKQLKNASPLPVTPLLPVMEFEILPLDQNAPRENFSNNPSYAFSSWVVAELDKFSKPSDSDLGTLANSLKTELVGCSDYARRGYNVLGLDCMNLQKNGLESHHPLFDIPKLVYGTGSNYAVPSDLLLVKDQFLQAQTSTSIYFGSKEYQSGVSASVNLGGGYAGYQASVGASYSKNQTDGASSKTVSVIKDKVAYEFWLVLNKERVRLHRETIEALKTLAVSPTDKTTAFFKDFGTHYPLAQLFGGRSCEESFFSEETINKAVSTKLSTSLSVSAPAVSGGASVEITDALSELSGQSKENTLLRNFGGKGGNFEAFDSGSSSDLRPLKAYLRPIHEIVHPELAGELLSAADGLLLKRARSLLALKLNPFMDEELKKLSPKETPPTKPTYFELKVDKITPIEHKTGVNAPIPGLSVVSSFSKQGDPFAETHQVSVNPINLSNPNRKWKYVVAHTGQPELVLNKGFVPEQSPLRFVMHNIDDEEGVSKHRVMVLCRVIRDITNPDPVNNNIYSDIREFGSKAPYVFYNSRNDYIDIPLTTIIKQLSEAKKYSQSFTIQCRNPDENGYYKAKVDVTIRQMPYQQHGISLPELTGLSP